MLNYIFKQWKQKKGILTLIILGFFVGSLFLSIGSSLSIENYNYIKDINSGNPKEQLEINIEYDNKIDVSKITETFNRIGEYGEVQIISNMPNGEEFEYDIIPTITEKMGDWHIPLISGKYLQDNIGEVVIGKTIASNMKLSIGDKIEIKGKKYTVSGISGRNSRETTWDTLIYMNFGDFVKEYKECFYSQKSSSVKIGAVLKNGRQAFMDDFDNIESYASDRGISINFEEVENSVEGSSTTNSVVLTILASGLIFLIAIINIINLMIYWMMERKKELGIMKALGATNSFLMKWTVIEMVMIALIGAVIALVCQLVVSIILAGTLNKNNIYIDISWINCVAAMGIASFCGVLSAVILALRTLKFNPVEVIACE